MVLHYRFDLVLNLRRKVPNASVVQQISGARDTSMQTANKPNDPNGGTYAPNQIASVLASGSLSSFNGSKTRRVPNHWGAKGLIHPVASRSAIDPWASFPCRNPAQHRMAGELEAETRRHPVHMRHQRGHQSTKLTGISHRGKPVFGIHEVLEPFRVELARYMRH